MQQHALQHAPHYTGFFRISISVCTFKSLKYSTRKPAYTLNLRRAMIHERYATKWEKTCNMCAKEAMRWTGCVRTPGDGATHVCARSGTCSKMASNCHVAAETDRRLRSRMTSWQTTTSSCALRFFATAGSGVALEILTVLSSSTSALSTVRVDGLRKG